MTRRRGGVIRGGIPIAKCTANANDLMTSRENLGPTITVEAPDENMRNQIFMSIIIFHRDSRSIHVSEYISSTFQIRQKANARFH